MLRTIIVTPRPALRRLGALGPAPVSPGHALSALVWVALVWMVLGATAGRAEAAASAWHVTEGAQARLISAVEATGDLESLPLGLELRLDPGWHTYWRTPGDAGLPPQLDASLSDNVAAVSLAYPVPKRVTLLGIETFGYDGHLVFPLTVEPASPGAPIDLRLAAQILVCAELCIPATFNLSLSLPAGPAVADPEAAQLIDRFVQAVPGDGVAAGLAIEDVAAEGETLSVAATAREPFETPDLFVEGGPAAVFAPPAITVTDGGRRLVATITRTRGEVGSSLADAPLTLTLVDGARAMEAQVTPRPGRVAGGGTPDGLAGMIAVALLGGLILNLMPCVLPVLSLKLLGALQAGGDRRRIRAGFLASAAGILVSFLALAGFAIGLSAAGATVGWGIQFQEPFFLIAMVVLLTGFAANLLGLFEIVLPWRIADAAGRAGAQAEGGLAAPFWTGVFATLLATPCSAPFLGTAVGFALSSGPIETLAIFIALGLGFALPYLAVAAFPRLSRLLPRPGRWMGAVKVVLALALLGTAVWLLGVLAAQIGAMGAFAVAALMAIMITLLWLRRRLPRALAATVAAGMAIAVTAAFATPLVTTPPAPHPGNAKAGWAAFDPAAIPARVAAGDVVFLDVTAEWCLTCKVNEALVIGAPEVSAALAAPGTVPMLADWTRPDVTIADWLAANGRYGIPFNAVYGPGAPQGIVLPELLTEEAVLDALDRARGPTS